MPRRDNGEGSKIYQDANGRYWKKITYINPETGRRKRTTVRGGSKSEVQEREKDIRKTVANGIKPNAGKVPLENWIKTWLDSDKKNSVEITTFNHYKTMAKLYIYGSDLAKIPLQQVKRADVQKFFNDLAETHSPATLKLLKAILANCFNVALVDNIIIKSPMLKISLPQIQKKKINPLSSAELKQLLDKVGNQNDMYTIILLGVSTGMRVGEICGLKWADVDMKKKTLHVSQQIKVDRENGGAPFLGKLKTPTSNRIIPITDRMIQTLKWHRRLQNKAKKDLGESYNQLELVFCEVTGEPLLPNTVSKRFVKAVKEAGIEHRSIHELRHTFASVAISQGLNIKATSEILGHSTISRTLDTYGHLLPGDKETVTDAVTAYFSL